MTAVNEPCVRLVNRRQTNVLSTIVCKQYRSWNICTCAHYITKHICTADFGQWWDSLPSVSNITLGLNLEATCADLTEMNLLVVMPSAAEAHICLNFRMCPTPLLHQNLWPWEPNPTWLCGRVLDLQSGGCRFESRPELLRTKIYSAFHRSVVGKWVPAIAGKAKAGMAHSDCEWTCGCAVKLWNPLRTRALPERFCGG